jgi:hypothetical protein
MERSYQGGVNVNVVNTAAEQSRHQPTVSTAAATSTLATGYSYSYYGYPSTVATTTPGYYYQPSYYYPNAQSAGLYNATAYVCCGERKPSLFDEARDFLRDRLSRRRPAVNVQTDVNIVSPPTNVRVENIIRERSADSALKTPTVIHVDHKPTIINDYSYVDKSSKTTANHFHHGSKEEININRNVSHERALPRSPPPQYRKNAYEEEDLRRGNFRNELYPNSELKRRSVSTEDLRYKYDTRDGGQVDTSTRKHVTFEKEERESSSGPQQPMFRFNPSLDQRQEPNRSRAVEEMLQRLPEQIHVNIHNGTMQTIDADQDEKSKYYGRSKEQFDERRNQMFYHGQPSQSYVPNQPSAPPVPPVDPESYYYQQRRRFDEQQEEVRRYNQYVNNGYYNNVLRR